MIQFLLSLADRARHRARQRSWPVDQAAGRRGEDLAHRYLERQGLTVVGRNFRPHCGRGEIDLVAWEGETLVFVEVKSRGTAEFGVPDRNVDRVKREALLRAAFEFARQAGVPFERVRFDLVSVIFSNPPSLSHVRAAIRPPSTL